MCVSSTVSIADGSIPAAFKFFSSCPAGRRHVRPAPRLDEGQTTGRINQEAIDGRTAGGAEVVGENLARLVLRDVSQNLEITVEKAVADRRHGNVADAAMIDAWDLLDGGFDHATRSWFRGAALMRRPLNGQGMITMPCRLASKKPKAARLHGEPGG